MEVLEFTKEQFRHIFEENAALSACVVEWFSMYTNLLLYETAHQEYNDSCVKLCNLLYLLFVNRAPGSEELDVTQEGPCRYFGRQPCEPGAQPGRSARRGAYLHAPPLY